MKKILVVEDEQAYAKLLQDQLTKAGYQVLTAGNGEDGLKLAADQGPDLILLDLLMPKVGGLAMLSTLRHSKWGEHIPVFVLTNVNTGPEISTALHDKASKYFVKSDLTLDSLLANIKIFLNV